MQITHFLDQILKTIVLIGWPIFFIFPTDAYEEVKTSVSEGKSLIATAVTGKGVQTAADATFQTMATNISSIVTGSTGWKTMKFMNWSTGSCPTLSINGWTQVSQGTVDISSGSATLYVLDSNGSNTKVSFTFS